MAKKKKQDKQEQVARWAAKEGFKLAYDEYGKPIISQAIVSSYFKSKGYEVATDNKTGDKVLVDREGNKVQDSQGQAISAGASAGLTTLAYSYLNDGEISESEAKQSALAAGMAYGQSYGSSSATIGDSPTYSAGYSGALAAGGSLASDWAAGRDADYEKAGIAGGKEYGKSYIKNLATKQGGESGGAKAGFFMSVGQSIMDYQKGKDEAANYYQKRQAQTYGKAELAGKLAGSMVTAASGGWGSSVGGIFGAAYASDKFREKDTFVYRYKDPANRAIRYDPETGKFVANEAIDMKKFRTHLGVSLGEKEVTEEERAHLKGTQEVNQARANILNDRLKNFDKLDAGAQLEMQGILTGKIDPMYTETIKNVQGKDIAGTSQVDINRGRNYQFKDWRAGDTGQYTATKGLYDNLKSAEETGFSLTQTQQRAVTDYEREKKQREDWDTQLSQQAGYDSTEEHVSALKAQGEQAYRDAGGDMTKEQWMAQHGAQYAMNWGANGDGGTTSGMGGDLGSFGGGGMGGMAGRSGDSDGDSDGI